VMFGASPSVCYGRSFHNRKEMSCFLTSRDLVGKLIVRDMLVGVRSGKGDGL
jgi:hypothetical protein